MAHRTTHALDWVRAALKIMGQRVHAGPDANAQLFGWEVTTTCWGLGRVYHDPRFRRPADDASTLPSTELP